MSASLLDKTAFTGKVGEEVVLELKIMDLVSILFSFIFSCFYWRVEDEEDKVWHCHRSHDMVTEVTHSHDTRINIEGSG